MASSVGLRAAKQQMRVQLKGALKTMTTEQKRDESLILTHKVLMTAYNTINRSVSLKSILIFY